MSLNRRYGPRVPARVVLNQYTGDEHRVCLSFNLGTDGIYVYHAGLPEASRRVVGLEFQLPGQQDSVWAKGQVRFSGRFGDFNGTGIAFTDMANLHWNMIQDWVLQSRLDAMRQQLRFVSTSR